MRPASIFEKSRMSLMIDSSASPLREIVDAYSCCSASRDVSDSRPLIPMIAFIGVRISCWSPGTRSWRVRLLGLARLLGLRKSRAFWIDARLRRRREQPGLGLRASRPLLCTLIAIASRRHDRRPGTTGRATDHPAQNSGTASSRFGTTARGIDNRRRPTRTGAAPGAHAVLVVVRELDRSARRSCSAT
jgi:hypothetical protein